MLDNPRSQRPLLRPGRDFGQKLIPMTRQPARSWFRVHRLDLPALDFALYPFHRYSHAACSCRLLYMGLNLQTCLWEVFGDEVFLGNRTIAASRWSGRCASRISVPELKVCALNLEKTREAMGVDKASLLAADLSIPQAWGRAVQEHPSGFQGLKYASRFVEQPCLALFDRGGLADQMKVTPLGKLEDLDAAVDWLHERKAALV